jgi:hypothetical protein
MRSGTLVLIALLVILVVMHKLAAVLILARTLP